MDKDEEDKLRKDLTDKIDGWAFGLVLEKDNCLNLCEITFNAKNKPTNYVVIANILSPKEKYQNIDELYKTLKNIDEVNKVMSEIRRINELTEEIYEVQEIMDIIEDVQKQITTNHVFNYSDFEKK